MDWIILNNKILDTAVDVIVINGISNYNKLMCSIIMLFIFY